MRVRALEGLEVLTVGVGDCNLLKDLGIPSEDGDEGSSAAHVSLDADTFDVLKLAHLRQATGLKGFGGTPDDGGHNRCRQRVRRPRLHRRHAPQGRLPLLAAPRLAATRQVLDGDNRELTASQGASLVERQCLDLGQILDDVGALDEDAVTGRCSDRARSGDGRCQDEGTGAAQDQQDQGAMQPRPEGGTCDQRSSDGVRARDQEHSWEQQPRDSIHKLLRLAPHRLRNGDLLLQLRQGRLIGRRRELHLHVAAKEQRARRHGAALALLDGHRLARERGLGEGGSSFDDEAIDGTLLAGPQSDNITGLEIRDRNDLAALRHGRRPRHRQLHGSVQGSRNPSHRPMLNELGEREERHQQRRLE
mmetsp:Transcript_52951/g.172333  ORF Transcript_52951/g.172333 Transcript_52951/m.172333 type:complete len:362 (-) Transcript_52951:1291-2376(-)